ncbi:MAG: histidine kinase dimerization/phospho-acceptor domain-containing protein [Bdellovibrionota bacterium]
MEQGIPYEILSVFLRGLSHEIRTPLSVISNQLYLLQHVEGGTEAGLQKVRHIDQLLNQFQPFLQMGVQEEVDVGELLEELKKDVPGEAKFLLHVSSPLLWNIDRARLKTALKALFEIYASVAPVSQCEVCVKEEGLFICGEAMSREQPAKNAIATEKCVRFSDVMSATLPSHSVLLLLLDAVFISQNIMTSLSDTHGVHLRQE